MDDDDDKDVLQVTASNWRPQTHFVWDVLLDQLLPEQNLTASDRTLFQEFFQVVVDGMPFAINHYCRPFHISHRVVVLFNVVTRTEILGIPHLPQVISTHKRLRRGNSVYEKFYAFMDQSLI